MASVEQELASYSRERLLEIAALLNPDGVPEELAATRWKRPTGGPPQAAQSSVAIRDERERAHGSLAPPSSVLTTGHPSWYQQAAASMANLSDLLADQLNAVDLADARDWFQRAAVGGDTWAMINLGDLLANRLDPPDLGGARDWFQRAAVAGDTRAMNNLGDLLANRLDPPDLGGARDWFQRAAVAGDTRAMNNLGDLLANRLDPPDLGGARDWFQRAAVAGDTRAMNNLEAPLDASGSRGPIDELASLPPVELPGGWEEVVKRLRPREREVMSLLAEGLPTAAIAERLLTSEYAVKAITRRIIIKLGVRSKTQVVAVAHKSGLLRTDVSVRLHPD